MRLCQQCLGHSLKMIYWEQGSIGPNDCPSGSRHLRAKIMPCGRHTKVGIIETAMLAVIISAISLSYLSYTSKKYPLILSRYCTLLTNDSVATCLVMRPYSGGAGILPQLKRAGFQQQFQGMRMATTGWHERAKLNEISLSGIGCEA